jgi:hypothetical protein
MDTIERLARALAEWDLGMTGNQADDKTRYGMTLLERRVAVERAATGKRDQAEFLLGAMIQPVGSTDNALDHLRRFRATFNAGEPVDEESRLTADDLSAIIQAVEAFGEDVVAPDPQD